ncbi:hypothetical protein Ahy_A07g031414 [Arachis hypogaea]|uniref:Protein FAR1-RELATED SEQUENCE n=1 Tax=Arachis hypogaea TaxID=3818 RepID=A0A445C3R9_ARAHY|nr:hypothetical protein Ahy_A07g031414 [Arachis hypogaea]
MDDSTSDSQLNQGEVDYEFESNEVPEFLTWYILPPLSVVDDQFVPTVGMTFTTLEDAGKFYRNYAKATSFSTRTNPTAGLNYHARIYIHTLKDVGAWIISKVVLDHSHHCCPSKAEMLKQHRELSMSIRCTIENNEEADSFDRNWNDFLLNFGLVDNKWLSGSVGLKSAAEVLCWVYYADLYANRHIWVPIYLDHHFWAGMRSTQRSESMHSFFNKEQAERESDAADFHTVIPCATKSSIEAQFQDVYTHQKFRKVQAQFRGKVNCITRLTNSALGYSVYEVGEQVSNSIFNKFVVTYDSVAADVKCQCLLFESRGILCRHVLSVLSFEQSKKVKRRHTHIKSSHDEPLLEPISKRFDQLVFYSQNICEFASELEELTAILHRTYDNVMTEMESLKAKRKGTSSLSHEDANLESVNELQSPQGFEQEDEQKIG